MDAVMSDSGTPKARASMEMHVSAHKTEIGQNSPIVEDRSVPEVLVDGICGISVTNAMPRLTLFTQRLNGETGHLERVVTARLAMTPDSANMIATAINEILIQLTDQNLIPPLIPIVKKDAP